MTEKKIRTPASPKVRKFARELGLDINLITGSQRQGRIIETDIKRFVKEQSSKKLTPQEKVYKNEFPHSDFGEIKIKDIPRIKKITAKSLSYSWATIPHVTNHDEADVTEMENFRVSLKDIYTGEKKKNYSTCIYCKSTCSYSKKISII